MGKLIYSTLTSLDDYVEDEHGRFGWGAERIVGRAEALDVSPHVAPDPGGHPSTSLGRNSRFRQHGQNWGTQLGGRPWELRAGCIRPLHAAQEPINAPSVLLFRVSDKVSRCDSTDPCRLAP